MIGRNDGALTIWLARLDLGEVQPVHFLAPRTFRPLAGTYFPRAASYSFKVSVSSAFIRGSGAASTAFFCH